MTRDVGQSGEITSAKVELRWLGQAGVLIQSQGHPTVCVDPYLSDSCSKSHGLVRNYPPPINPADLEAQVVLASHWHPDHLDPETIGALTKRQDVLFAGPPSCTRRAIRWGFPPDQVREMRRGETIEPGSETAITAVNANHMVPGALCEDANGYLIQIGQITIYHTGDTVYDVSMRGIEPGGVDVMLVCFNGSGGNLDPHEAAFLASRIEPQLLIPMHFGMWANQADPSPDELIAALRKLCADIEVEVPEMMVPIVYPSHKEEPAP